MSLISTWRDVQWLTHLALTDLHALLPWRVWDKDCTCSAPSSLFPGQPVLRKYAFNCSCLCHTLRPIPDGEGMACTVVYGTSLPKERKSSQSTEPCIGTHILQFYQFSLKGNISISSLSVFCTHLSTGVNLGKEWGDSSSLRWQHLGSYSLGPKAPALLSTLREGGGAP